MPGWKFPRHLRVLEGHVLRLLTDPDYNRLIVELPVRHGKSLYCVWAFLTWYLLNFPDRSAIVATYQQRFSGEWSHKVRRTVEDYGGRLTGVGVGGIATREHWTLSHPYAGQLRTGSPRAGIAGKGADLIVADDLVANQQEAASPTRRDSLSTWFNAELLSRLEPGGKLLMVMSRRHPDDQSGRCLDANGELPPHEQWHRLTMPALDDEGRALWPGRWPARILQDKKRNYELAGQSYLWDCLYQQDARGDSSIIEWPETYFRDPRHVEADGTVGWSIGYDELPPSLPIKWRLLALDPSKGKTARPGDYSAWSDVTLDRERAGLWVVPTVRVMPAEAVEDLTVEMLARERYDALIVETNGFQERVADNIVRKCREGGIPCNLFKKDSTENKEVRIRLGLGPILEQKRIRLCTKSSTYRLALQQLREFPSASHEDFPDSLTLCLSLIEHLLRGKRK